MSPSLITLIMFGGLVLGLLGGLPIAFVMGGIAVGVTYFLSGPNSLMLIAQNTFGSLWNPTYIAIPLFIYIGVLLERSGVAESLFETIHRWSGSMRGGLAFGTVFICAVFAAMTGLIAAATVTMGLIALPAMLNRRYDKHIAIGTVCAAGTLGILIPPSLYLIILASLGDLSVGRVFMAGVFPGLLLTFLFFAYIGIRALLQPDLCPSHPERFTMRQKVVSTRGLILPIVIILSILGTIFFGVATPTEASAVGALATIITAAIHRTLTWENVKGSALQTFRMTAMIMWVLFGVVAFSSVYFHSGGATFISGLLESLIATPWISLIIILVIIFIMGCFVDPWAIMFIIGPITFPIIKGLGFDPVWYSILFVIMIMTGLLTPPFGFSLIFLKAVAPPEISVEDIWGSVWPFVGIMILAAAITMLFPEIALWLPEQMVRMRAS